METEIRKTLGFESAHKLDNLPKGHKCGRLHGHSFKMTIVVRAKIKEGEDWVMDYAEIKRIAKPLIEHLDHHYLNDIKEIGNPTSENIAKYAYEELSKKIDGLYQIIIAETCTSECRYPAR